MSTGAIETGFIAVNGNCYRCGEPGHWKGECLLLIPAATKAEHDGRIAFYVRRWQAGHMTIHQKRAAISDENAMWKAART